MMAAATADYRLMKYTPKTRNQGGHGGTAPTEILFVLHLAEKRCILF